MRVINKIVVHCSDTPTSMDIGVDTIRKWHVEERGWNDVGYHYVVTRKAKVEYGREESVEGAHVSGHNADSIGVCIVGGKGGFNFTREQMLMLESLVDHLLRKYPGSTVCGHRDFPGVTKQCPTFDVKAWWYGAA